MKKFFLSVYTLIATTSIAFASEIPASMKQTMTHDTGMPSMINLIFSMAVVIGLIYATGWIYNKLNFINKEKFNPANSTRPEKNRFKILQSMPLGQNRYLYSVEMNNKVMLIGSTPSHINMIREFDSLQLKQPQFNPNKKEYATKIVPAASKNAGVNIDEIYQKYKK